MADNNQDNKEIKSSEADISVNDVVDLEVDSIPDKKDSARKFEEAFSGEIRKSSPSEDASAKRDSGRDDYDYQARVNKAKLKRSGMDPVRLFCIGAGVVIVILLAVIATKLVKSVTAPETVPETPSVAAETVAEITKPEEPSLAEEISEDEELLAKASVVESYENLGLVNVEGGGYLNMREQPEPKADIIGKLYNSSACEILNDKLDGWYLVKSGNITGYIKSDFVSTGDLALSEAFEQVHMMAVITADKLNIRSEADPDAQVVGSALNNERYEILGEENGFVKIAGGYVAEEFVDKRYALNEARKLDLRTMVLNLYDNIGISSVDNYLNVREAPNEDAQIIGKMTSKSAGEILGTSEDGKWYKMKSGPVTGYVSAEFILTGQAANDKALEVAELMAIVNTDALNARTEPSTDAPIWTQVLNSERYAVIEQQDGWVKIALDETSAYVDTNFVDVRYALNEAIKWTPIVVEPPKPASTKPGSNGTKPGSSKPASNGGGNGGSSGGGGGVGSALGNLPASSTRSAIANYATQFLGNPYVWGGTSLTNGADCSGFTMSVMNNFGVSLPHQSGAQSGCGQSVSSSQMRPGDLVFYTNSGGTINHVALYIGNGQVCHASNARDGIKISTWNYRTPAKIVNVLGD